MLSDPLPIPRRRAFFSYAGIHAVQADEQGDDAWQHALVLGLYFQAGMVGMQEITVVSHGLGSSPPGFGLSYVLTT